MCFGQIITVLIHVSIWRAVLYEGTVAAGQPVTFQDMISYTVICNAINLLMNFEVIGILDSKIRSGEIAMDLLKPVSLPMSGYWPIDFKS
jgi:ABC-2 type transport system permease protein